MKRGLVVVLALGLVACGGGSDDGDDASSFAEETVEQARKGQNGRRWDDLHPAQQAVVNREQFIECTQDDSLPVENIEATESFTEPVNIPGVGNVETTAVTIEYDIGERSDAFTMHVLEVDGDWKWFLTQEDVTAFAAGECP